MSESAGYLVAVKFPSLIYADVSRPLAVMVVETTIGIDDRVIGRRPHLRSTIRSAPRRRRLVKKHPA